MKNTVSAVVLLCCLSLAWLGTVCTTSGQPILERLERRIRDRVNQPAAPDKPADRPAPQKATKSPDKKARGQADFEPGYLGVVADDTKDRGRGVRILKVRPDGPADKAGLRKQDLITAMAGVRVRQMSDMADILALFPAGHSLEFEVLRAEKRQEVKVTLGRRPPPSAPPIAGPRLALPALPTGPEAPAPDTPQKPAGSREEPTAIAKLFEQLERRIAELERRVAELEKALAGALKKQ